MPAAWHIQTPSTAGAIGIIQITGAPDELDLALCRVNLPVLVVGQARLANLLNIDRGLIARWSTESVHLFPHGGPAVIRAIVSALTAAGVPQCDVPDPMQVYPEAATLLEARMLHALSRAASPLAVDLLLDQPRRWHEQPEPSPDDPRHAILHRLIDPPLVVAIGPSNIGKSSLLNALAGQALALVANEPGTTRDHVGALIDMSGLIVRYIDTPGRRDDAPSIEQEAARLSEAHERAADLVLSCGDVVSPPLPSNPDQPTLTVALRIDLGLPTWPHDAAVSALQGRGISDLVRQIRQRLVPDSALSDPRPWRFW